MRLAFLLCMCLLSLGCTLQKSVSGPLLLEREGWTTDTLKKGVVWYRYHNNADPQFAHQYVNVVSLDPRAGNMVFQYSKEKDSLSALAKGVRGAVAGINATYFMEEKDTADYMHLRVNGRDLRQVRVPGTSIYWWKHRGMFTFNKKGTRFHIASSPLSFSGVKAQNIMTGAPILIENFKPLGLSFADTAGIDMKGLHYEHYLKHQGVRHPRTAIAITPAGSLLLITVDGRNKDAQGMSARELTAFLQRFFNPQSAMNIDGGGSTTMWVAGQPFNGIVNYPTDNKKFDHYGQRRIETAIFVR